MKSRYRTFLPLTLLLYIAPYPSRWNEIDTANQCGLSNEFITTRPSDDRLHTNLSNSTTPGYPQSPSNQPPPRRDRFISRGNTYQPSQLKRKRRHGFLARMKTKTGRKSYSDGRLRAENILAINVFVVSYRFLEADSFFVSSSLFLFSLLPV
ncbi:hypothetical protein PSTT_12388 [Puccinia striiformis]|uniref:Uncharacterized protein n=1 Tax=Puccinia striiformis TaxID=27350 RepID=A0A2S4UWQ6_9BASI|nr:hypothetical protein PSTT_12388 [Puccinia striiformis]